MIIYNKDIKIDELINNSFNDDSFIKKRSNGIYLSNDQIKILDRYGIDYQRYNSLSNLIFDIEEILNEESDLEDLEAVSDKLSEFNYYNNTNK